MDPAIRPRYTKALLRLTKASGLYPECLVHKGIDIDPYPVAVGSFGDVFRGQLHGQMVAVKIARVSLYDYDDRLKVTSD